MKSNLKKIKNSVIYIGIAFLMVFGSCEKMLDQKLLKEADQSIVITDKVSANAVVAGLYNELQSANYYGANFLIIGDVTTFKC